MPRRAMTRSRAVGVCGLAGLLLLAVVYAATREPAPRIRVRWRDGVTAQQQSDLETRYLLRNGRDRFPGGSLAYDLLDTSRSNVRRLVEDPAVADTNDIDRNAFVVEPGTGRGDTWTWAAYGVPGLRDAWSQGVLVLLLAGAALVGMRREWLMVVRGLLALARRFAHAWNRHRRAPGESRDLFDVSRRDRTAAARGRAGTMLMKIAAAALLLPAAGLPVLETWETLALAAAWLAVVFGDCRRGWWRLPAAAALVLAVMGLRTVLPRADIAEAHNVFLLPAPGGPLEQGLPPVVFASFKAQFDALYPDTGVVVDESWRARRSGARSLYASSADAIWRPAKYTRQVDAIDFRTLAEFRGGFANDLRDNFWAGDVAREELPFYAMYELSAASVGSRLRWTGQLFWERPDGGFDEIRHTRIDERPIEPHDAGRRVYAVFFPKRDRAFEFQLVPSRTLRAAGWAEALLTLIGLGAVAIVIRLRWSACLRAASLFLAAYVVLIGAYDEPSAARLGARYLPHGGGGDGLVYEAHGREMAFLAGSGRVVEAMKGVEAVFGSTPGTRYVRMAEKLVFGDTNHLFALMLAAVPIVVFYLMRRLMGALPAWVVTAAFLVLPVPHLAFMQYYTSGRSGFADWLGAGLFLLGLTLLVYHEPGARERPLSRVWAGGAALAGAMCIRPHVALAAAWVAAVYAWLSWRRKDRRAGVALAAGLAVTLWIPFHNWYYAQEFYLLTTRHSTSFSPSRWQDFVRAPADLFQGQADSDAVTATATQLEKWVWDPGFAYAPASPPLQWTARLVRLAALGATAWALVVCGLRRRRARSDLVMIAGAAVWAHVAVFFVFGHHQRYLLAWDLSMVVLVAWLIGGWGAEATVTTPARDDGAAGVLETAITPGVS